MTPFASIALAVVLAGDLLPPEVPPKQTVLASSPSGKPGWKYQVVCESCQKARTCLSVKAAGKTITLDSGSNCFAAPDDEARAEITAKNFTLAPGVTGVLVKEESGGEAIGHRYWLVGLVDGETKLLWEKAYSTHEIVPIDSYTLRITDRDKNGRQEIDFDGRFPVTGDRDHLKEMLRVKEHAADVWEHDILELDDTGRAMVPKSPHEEWATVLGSFAKLPDALKFKLSLLGNDKCNVRGTLVVESKSFPKPPKGTYVVAFISESEKDARDRLDGITSCNAKGRKIPDAITRVR